MSRARLSSLLAVAVATAACGPKSSSDTIPTLPGDGSGNVSQPGQKASAAPDPWATAELIPTPAAQPPAAVQLPPVERFKLKNGLEVMVVKSQRLPLVTMQLAIKVGRADEPHTQLGVSAFVAAMLAKGTTTRKALDIAKTIDFVGGDLRAEASFEATVVSCNVLSRDLGTCMTLLPDVIEHPSFPDAEMAPARELLLADVKQRLDDAGNMATAQLQNLLWGDDHVRGWVTTEAGIGALDRKALVAWHKAWFSPDNAVLAIAGDVDVAKLKKDLEKAFAAWRPVKVPARPKYDEPVIPPVRIRLVDKPHQSQTHIRIGQLGIRHDDPRFYDTMVWNYVLGGGGFSSRLMEVVRVKGGKTYGASSTFDRNLDRGSFVAATFTRNAEALATVKLVLNELGRMQQEGPNDKEVADAIANIAGGYGLRFESASDIAGALLGARLHGLGEDYVTQYALRIGAVTAATATKAVGTVLDPGAMVVVMVGDASELEPQLKKEGWQYDKVALDAPIGKQPEPPPAPIDPKIAAAGRKLLDEALAAKGGEKKLGGVKTLVMNATGTLAMQGKSLDAELVRTYVAPGKIRVDMTLGKTYKISYATDGKAGWQLSPEGVVDIPASELKIIERQRWLDAEFVLLRHKDPKVRVEALPDETVDAVTYAVVKIGAPDNLATAKLYLDKKTKLLARMTYVEGGGETVETYSDYKDVNGLKIAHTRTTQGAGAGTALTVQSVALDGKVDPVVFGKPAS